MQQIKFSGSFYQGMTTASQAWADCALPDPSVIGADEDPGVAAQELEAFWWREAEKIGEGAPDDVNVDSWRAHCRLELVKKIEHARKLVALGR